jgi:DNA-binding transcriptional regulator of glucitol operon
VKRGQGVTPIRSFSRDNNRQTGDLKRMIKKHAFAQPRRLMQQASHSSIANMGLACVMLLSSSFPTNVQMKIYSSKTSAMSAKRKQLVAKLCIVAIIKVLRMEPEDTVTHGLPDKLKLMKVCCYTLFAPSHAEIPC